MRRLLGLCVVVALLVPAVGAVAGEPYEYYKDKFNGSGYGGSDGSLSWESPWIEIDESDGPGEGNVHLGPENCFGSNCLHFEGELLGLEHYGVRRSADLSMFETVELCFEMEISGLSEAGISVYVTADGSNWDRKGSYSVLLQPGYHHPIIDLHDYRTEQFAVKFVVDGLLLGGEGITIDNVELKGTVASTSTSTSTSTSSTSSTTSTTSTTTSTTSTTKPRSTATSTSSTSTTVAGATSTTQPGSATSSTEASRQEAAQQGTTTTTTAASTTTTSSGTGAGFPPQPPFDSGLRDTPGGLMADYSSGMMGDMPMGEVEVLGAEITADFSMAVEAFETAKVWVAVLTLFIAAAIVSGMDSRRSRPTS